LNLLSQVGPYPETPPWLRPIALFLYGVKDPFRGCWLKTEGATSRTQQGHNFYTIKHPQRGGLILIAEKRIS
jgi:hypothetical protein